MSGKWETIHKYLQPSLIAGMLCGKSPGLQALNAHCRSVCMRACVCVHVCATGHECRGQRTTYDTWFQKSTSGGQAWGQVPLPADPSH